MDDKRDGASKEKKKKTNKTEGPPDAAPSRPDNKGAEPIGGAHAIAPLSSPWGGASAGYPNMPDAWAAGAALLKPRDHEAEKLALQDPSVWGSWRPRSNPTPGENEPDMVQLRLLQQLQREQQAHAADTCRQIQALHPNVMARHPGATLQASPPGDVHPAREAAAFLEIVSL